MGRLAKQKSNSERPIRVAIIVSRYNASITDALLDAAIETFVSRGGRGDDVVVVPAPGAFELPVLALHAAATEGFDGVVALGCVIRGETSHDRYISDAVAQGLTNVAITTGTPVAFGVITADTPKQARDRAGGRKGNKGAEAMSALLDTIGSIMAVHAGVSAAATLPSKPDKAARKPRARGGR